MTLAVGGFIEYLYGTRGLVVKLSSSDGVCVLTLIACAVCRTGLYSAYTTAVCWCGSSAL